jgi:hypothetical protein
LPEPAQRLDDALDLLGAFGVLAAKAGGELFGGRGGVGGEELTDEGDLGGEPFRPGQSFQFSVFREEGKSVPGRVLCRGDR